MDDINVFVQEGLRGRNTLFKGHIIVSRKEKNKNRKGMKQSLSAMLDNYYSEENDYEE